MGEMTQETRDELLMAVAAVLDSLIRYAVHGQIEFIPEELEMHRVADEQWDTMLTKYLERAHRERNTEAR